MKKYLFPFFIFIVFLSMGQRVKNQVPDISKLRITDKQKIDTLFYYAGKYGDLEPKMSDSLYREVLNLSYRLKLKVASAKALTGLGVISAYQNDYFKSDSLFNLAIGYLDKSSSEERNLLKGEVLKHKARSFFFRYQLDSALIYFIDTEKIFREEKSTEELIPVLNALGILHGEVNQDYEKAIQYFEESIKLNYQVGDSLQAAKGLQNVAQIYDLRKDFNKSNQLLKKSNGEVLKGGDLRSLAIGYNTLASNYKALGFLDSSALYFEKSIAINTEIDDILGLSEDLVGYSQVLFEVGSYSAAIESAMKVKELTGNNKVLQLSYALISDCYEALGEFESSLKYLRQANQIRDSIYNKDKQASITELQTKYETEQKEQEIELLSKENELAANRQRLLIVASGLLLLIIGLVFFQYRQRNKYAKKIEETMASKEKLFSVIAHDLKSPLSAFSSMSSTLAENIDAFQKDQIVTYLKKFQKSSQNLSELLNNLLQWSLSQTGTLSVNPEELDLKQTMENAVKPLTDLAESKGIKLSIESEGLKATADSKMVETVIRNLVSNALKFTDSGGEVSISSRQEGNQVFITVKDSGIGMDREEASRLFDVKYDPSKIGDHEGKGTGLGLILSKELIEKNHGIIGVESEKDKGSRFYFTLPSAA